MSESTITVVRQIMELVSSKKTPLTGEECAYHATQLSGYLYRLQVLENEAKRSCDLRLMSIMRDVGFWKRLSVKPSKSTAETQLHTEDAWQTYLTVQALRVGAQETIRSLRAQVRLYQEEHREFTH